MLLFRVSGCCFVTYYTRKAALRAQDALHNIKTLDGVSVIDFFILVLCFFMDFGFFVEFLGVFEV